MDRVVRRPRRWRVRALAGAGVLGLGVAAYLLVGRLSAHGARTLEVAGDRITTARVESGTFDDFIQARGRFIPFRTVYLDTVQGGRVDAIHVENGATVAADQPLVDLSNTALQLDVISREAQVTEQLNNLRALELSHERNQLDRRREAIEVDYQIARLGRELERSNELVKTGSVPRSDIEQMGDELAYYRKRQALLRDSQGDVDRLERAQLAQLRTAGQQLAASLTVARNSLDSLHVRATMAGQLTAFSLEVGQSLAPGERIGQIDDPSAYKILADIDEFYLGRVDINLRAECEVSGTTYQLTVAKIRPQVADNRFQVDLVFDGDAPSGVRRGQTAQLRLQLGQPTPALLIPNAAFYNDTGGAWVFVVSGDRSRAIKRKVRLGRRNPQKIEVLEGLAAGEEIVTSPYTSFLEMEQLDLTPGGSQAQPRS